MDVSFKTNIENEKLQVIQCGIITHIVALPKDNVPI